MIDPSRPWPLTLTAAQRAAVARLADLILPADAHGPAPSSLGIAEFFDEWMSAPYPRQQEDRVSILALLARLDREGEGDFIGADDQSTTALLERIALTDANSAFARCKTVCLLGYYTCDAGMGDIGYVAPQPATSFPGPPSAVRVKLGL